MYSDLNGFYEFYIYVNILKVCFVYIYVCIYILQYTLNKALKYLFFQLQNVMKSKEINSEYLCGIDSLIVSF